MYYIFNKKIIIYKENKLHYQNGLLEYGNIFY
jgi:hypothetical protein